MGVRSMTVRRFEEIQRRLSEGRGLREIARALGCSRDTVREVRDGLRNSPDAPKALPDPLWMLQVDWPPLIHGLGLGHPLKFLWEERAQHLTTYSNFWKQFYRKFPQYRQASVTAREFAAGERVEVDYAGDPIEWFDLKTGEIHHAWIFAAVLGFSHLLYARAAEDTQSRNWLGSHRRMFAFYAGVTHVLVPDCLKRGVLKCHLYDPDLNPAYAALGVHFSTAIVPARPGHPKSGAETAAAKRLRRRGMEGSEAACGLLCQRRKRLLQRPAYPSPQEAADQDHREPGRDLPQSRAPRDPSAQSAQGRPTYQDRRALPTELCRLLRVDATKAAVTVALHPPGSERSVRRAVQ
jgi:hypothetical protein